MKIEYCIEFALKQDLSDGHHYYAPIGVWAHGLDQPGFSLDYGFLESEPDADERANWVINNLVDSELQTLPDGWLQHYIDTMPIMQGDCSPIYVTEDATPSSVIARVLAQIAGGAFANPPLPVPDS